MPWAFLSQEVEFNPAGGNHIGLKEIRLNIPSGFSVHYTKDGTPPGKGSQKASSSLPISGNTTFRFAIFDSDGKKKEVIQSYFVDRIYTLPIVSIVGDPADFFDEERGIYAKGCCADTINPYMGANFWKDWERKINIELYETDGKCGLNQGAGIKIFGGYSVANPQKSFALYARKKYGEKKFEHQIFPQLEFTKYNSFILRNAGGDMFGAHIRDVFATQVIKSTGLAIQEYRQVVVFINGQYWGKYNLREKINEHYIKAHYGIPKDSLMIMRHNGDRQHGPGTDYRSFMAKLPNLDLRKKKDLDYVDGMMDIENYFLYNIAEIYSGNRDAGGNIRYYKSMQPGGKWRWIYYDLDAGLNINGSHEYQHNSVHDFTTLKNEIWPNPPWSTLIIRKLLENDSLKHRYINHFADLLNTNYKPENAKAVLDKLVAESAQEINFHLKRWNILRSRYDKSVADIYLFIDKRPDALRSQLKERFNLGQNCTITIKAPKEGGKVQFNSIKIKEDFTGIYFQGIPLHLVAKPEYDYEFVGWKGIKDDNPTQYFKCDQPTLTIEPIFKRKNHSPYKGVIVITEIDASQDSIMASGDWFEIYNNSNQRILLKDWFIKDNKNKHKFSFPSVYIEPGEHIVICQDSASFAAAYTKQIKLIGSFDFGLKKGKDHLRLYDAKEMMVDEVDLSKFDLEEEDGMNLIRIDYRIPGFVALNWLLERPTPGAKSLAYIELLKKETDDKKWQSVFFYSGISAAVLLIALFLFPLFRRKRKES
jgi:hypothetical protein